MKTSTDTVGVEIGIQRVYDDPQVPADPVIERCARMALADLPEAAVNIRIVDADEGRALNRQWRGKDHATNVLSFPAALPEGTGLNFLGDVVLCGPVVVNEAGAQGKPVTHHWAHLVIHGILHLRGFDHISVPQAQEMENREIELLGALGINDPYVIDDD